MLAGSRPRPCASPTPRGHRAELEGWWGGLVGEKEPQGFMVRLARESFPSSRGMLPVLPWINQDNYIPCHRAPLYFPWFQGEIPTQPKSWHLQICLGLELQRHLSMYPEQFAGLSSTQRVFFHQLPYLRSQPGKGFFHQVPSGQLFNLHSMLFYPGASSLMLLPPLPFPCLLS